MDTENPSSGLRDLLAANFHTYSGKRVPFQPAKFAVAIDRTPATLFTSIQKGRMTLDLAQAIIRHSKHLVETHPGYAGKNPLTFEDLKPFVVAPDCLD